MTPAHVHTWTRDTASRRPTTPLARAACRVDMHRCACGVRRVRYYGHFGGLIAPARYSYPARAAARTH